MYYIEKRNDPGGKVLGIDGNIVGEDRIEGEFVEKHKCRIYFKHIAYLLLMEESQAQIHLTK